MVQDRSFGTLRRALGKQLRQVRGAGFLRFEDGGATYDRLRLVFEDLSVVIHVDDDTDEILAQNTSKDSDPDVELTPFFDRYITKELGWYWSCYNSNGYNDALMLSFSGPEPQLVLVGMASKIHIYNLLPARTNQNAK